MAQLSRAGKLALDNAISKAIQGGNVPGFVLGVSNMDEEIYFGGGGPKSIGSRQTETVNPDSVFWICSQTKMIVALAALKLIELGKITLETPVSDYIEEFKDPIVVARTSTQKTAYRPAKLVVTVKHLLNSSSGLFYPVVPHDLYGLSKGYFSKEMHRVSDPQKYFFDIIKGELPALPLKFEPGTDFVYGWNSDVLGFLIERVTKQSLEQFCQEYIFRPLGLQASFYLSHHLRKNLVDMAYRDSEGRLSPFTGQVEIIEQHERNLHLHLGGIGLYMSTRDYLKILRHIMQINAGLTVSHPILSQKSVQSIFTPMLTVKGSQSLSTFIMARGTQWTNALAVTTKDWPKRRRKGTCFWSGWAGTIHFIDPETGISLVFGTQVIPSEANDPQVSKLFENLEQLVYAGLAPVSKL